jgi:hypothetical protein
MVQNILIGFFVGAFCSAILIVIIYYFLKDYKNKNEEKTKMIDIENKSTVNIVEK